MATNYSTKYQISNRYAAGLCFLLTLFLDVWKWDETLAFAFNMLRPNEEVSK